MLACIPLYTLYTPVYSRQITCSPPAGVVDVIVWCLRVMVSQPVASLGSKATIPPFSAPCPADGVTLSAKRIVLQTFCSSAMEC